MVVFFHASLFHRMGSGPLWTSTVVLEGDRCRANWWTNLLFINNYVHPDNMCMFQSWYLSVDTQLFIVGILLVYCIGRWPCLGYSLLASLSTLAILVPIFNTWWKEAEAFLLPFAKNTADVVSYKYFTDVYVRTENRAAPYFIGVMVGVLLVKREHTKFRIGKAMSLLALVLVEGAFFGSFFASYWFYKPDASYTPLQAGLFTSLSRVAFAISRAGIILLVTFGSLDVLGSIFSWKPFRVLSRLVYGAYLVHTLAHLYHKGTLRLPLQTVSLYPVWMLFGDLVFSFATSFLLMLLLESPVRALSKLVLQKRLAQHNQKQET
ncbi:nose resistant to fluoxetine protein 6-like [Bacillus rossius redtenbacheri]|uniref:nose resistant to fluoxetine protein 6-like n=1 Tax=Bacillus rossius redtenbacheri TaxID=93214 RepID=UPI002FDEAF6A